MRGTVSVFTPTDMVDRKLVARVGILADLTSRLLSPMEVDLLLHNLVEGFLSLSDPPKIVVLIHGLESKRLRQYLCSSWNGRVEVLPAVVDVQPDVLASFTSFLLATDEWFHKERQRLRLWRQSYSSWLLPTAGKLFSVLRRERGDGTWQLSRFFQKLFVTFLLFPLMLVTWMASGMWNLLFGFLFPVVMFPFRFVRLIIDDSVLWSREQFSKWAQLKRGTVENTEQLATDAGCDVWLVLCADTAVQLLSPHIVMVQDLAYRQFPQMHVTSKRNSLEQRVTTCITRASMIAVMTQFVKEEVVRTYFHKPENVRIIPGAPRLLPSNDLESEETIGSFYTHYGIGPKYLFYPEWPRPDKNHTILVRALRLVCEMGEPDLEMIFVGNIEANSALYHVIENQNLKQRIHFVGSLNFEELRRFYRHALLVPLPSFYEGTGLLLLEALQQRCPTVCADVPGFRQLLEATPEIVPLFDPWSPYSLARAIKLVLSRREHYVKRQQEGYLRISGRGWREVTAEYVESFETIVENCHRQLGEMDASREH